MKLLIRLHQDTIKKGLKSLFIEFYSEYLITKLYQTDIKRQTDSDVTSKTPVVE